MRFSPVEKLKQRFTLEKVRLETGERPPSRFTKQGQRRAAKALAVFFILMLMLTLLSRMADSVTVNKVKTVGTQSGVLTERINASGSIEALGDMNLTLPAGIPIEKINVTNGQVVRQGDPLMQFNLDEIKAKIDTLKSEIQLLDLKINSAAKGNTSEGTDAIVEAQQALKNAEEDYQIAQASAGVSKSRAAEDLAAAQAAYTKAQEDFKKATDKAYVDRLEKAEADLAAAQQALEDARQAQQDAIDAARSALDGAQDSKHNANQAYQAALAKLNQAQQALDSAKAALDAANASGDADAIASAQAAVNAAQSAYDQAKSALDAAGNQNSSAGDSVDQANNNLNKTADRWRTKIERAEAEVKKAQEKLDSARSSGDVSEEAGVIAAQGNLDAAQKAVQGAERAQQDAESAAKNQTLTAQRAVETARRGVKQAGEKAETDRKTNAETRQQAEVEKLGFLSDKRQKETQLEKLQEIADGEGIMKSPVDGSIVSIVEETGVTQDGQKLAAISRKDMGFAFRAKMPEKEAENLNVGDKGTLTYQADGKSKTAEAAVSAIGPADDEGMVTVTVNLPQGDYAVGSASMEISRQSQQYPMTLPLGALRSDAGGDFVYVVRDKKTVMGTEQVAEKVAVTVKDKDSEKMAVDSSLLPDDQIIVSNNKPISEGDRVRLDGDDTKK